MDEVIQRSPIPQQTPTQPEMSPKNSSSNWLRTLAIGFGIVSIGTAIAIGGYFLGTKNSQPVVENKIVTQPSPTPIDETANWKTYTNTQYGFEIKYPADTRILKEGSQGLIASINFISSDFRLSSTGISISAVSDVKSCIYSTGTKNINGNTFLITRENSEDGAAGGERHIISTYHISHGNVCYEIQSSIGYTSIEFSATKPIFQQIQQEKDWIQTQQQLNNQILSTFKFTDQNQTVDETANWKTYASKKLGFSIKYPSLWTIRNNPSQDPFVYIDSDIKASWGNSSSANNGGIPFYIFISQILNPTSKQFKDLATQDLNNDLKNIFTYTQDKIGPYIIYKTDMLPSAYGALNAYITLDGSKYITIGLAPYDTVKPPNNQNKILPLFNQILSTFRFAN